MYNTQKQPTKSIRVTGIKRNDRYDRYVVSVTADSYKSTSLQACMHKINSHQIGLERSMVSILLTRTEE